MADTSFPSFVDFPFRAQRGYVHSTSICNRFARHFGQCERFELVLKHWMDSRLSFTPVAEVRPGEGSGYVRLRRDGVETIWEIAEDKAHPVAAREPYDEDALVSAGDVEGRRLTCRPGAGGTFFDRLIAANKVLINTALAPGVKLIAAKVLVEGFPPDDAPFTLEIASHVGTRIFKSRLDIDGARVGEVVFYGE